jgi:CheY-like chemotaxis protein
VIHLEQHKAFRDAVSECLGGLPGARYLNAPESNGEAATVLVVNLMNRVPDPLAAIAAAVADAKAQHIIAYCAEGAHGFLFGKVDFLVAPLDADSCVARLLESRGAVQRLLAVSENIEIMGALRVAFARKRCSTSVALDLRQVTDLFTMIDPEVVLIDLGLPGGDALRLLMRLRADPKTRNVPIALLLPPNLDASDFRRHALRAVREQTLSPADLAQALRQCISIATPGNESTVAASQTA